MTPDRLAEIEGRVMLISPGPWRVEVLPDKSYPQRVYDRRNGLIAECFLGPQYPLAEAEFIAAARTDVPELVVEVRALETEVGRLRTVVDEELARHTPIPGDQYAEQRCRGCISGYDPRTGRLVHAAYPCQTRLVLAPVATTDEETN